MSSIDESIDLTPESTRDLSALLIWLIIAFCIAQIIVDWSLFDYRWRPDVVNTIIYSLITSHLLSVAGLVYVIFYCNRIEDKLGRRFLKILLGLFIGVMFFFWLGNFAMSPGAPFKTYKSKVSDNVYWVYPGQQWFRRRGYWVYEPKSDWEMEATIGEYAMDFDSSWTEKDTLYIGFQKMDGIFRSGGKIIYKFDLTEKQY